LAFYKFEDDWSPLGEAIRRAIQRAARYAASDEEAVVQIERNGVILNITEKSSVEALIKEYDEQTQRNQEEYLNSPEYAEWEKQHKQHVKQINKEAEVLIEEFKKLNLTGTTPAEKAVLLDWLRRYQPYSDFSERNVKNDQFVIKTLEKAGYHSGEYVGFRIADLPRSEREHVQFRFIVGQAMASMKYLAMSGSVIDKVNHWMREFAPA
jgi:hypothetical protein